MTACLHILHSTTDCCLFFTQEKLCLLVSWVFTYFEPDVSQSIQWHVPTLIVRWWRELGPFGPIAIILDAASPLATRLSLHLIEVVNFVVDQLARNHQSPHWDQSGLNQGFTMMMRRRRNYWMWRHHQSVGGDPQNPPEDLWILRSLVIYKTVCPVFAFLSQHQCVTPRTAL